MSTFLPAMTPLRLLRALIRVPPRSSLDVDERNIVYHLPQIDHAHLQRYCELLGFNGDRVPLTYCALLAQRAQFDLMLSRAFPYRIAGVIHAEQTAASVAPLTPQLPLEFNCRPPQPVHHRNGRLSVHFSIDIEQSGRPVCLISSTLVVRRGSRAPHTPRRDEVAADGLHSITEWPTGLRYSRAYALLSGDWNPIHFSGVTARLFGLRRPIVHGMETLARSTAALERRLARPVTQLQARFRRPITAGSTVNLAYREADGAFRLSAADERCVEGLLTA